MPDTFPRRLSSAAACAIAAARAMDAVELWAEKLTEEEHAEVCDRLAARQEWRALYYWKYGGVK